MGLDLSIWPAYVEMARVRFLTWLAYRVNYYSGILVYTINIGAYYFLWQAIYHGRTTLGGLTAAQMTSYVTIGWLARAFYFNGLDREIADEIRDGTVAVQLIRPYNYLLGKSIGALGEAAFRLLFFTVPGLGLALLLFPVRLPGNAHSWGLFGLATMMSFLLNTQINIVTGLLAFFMLNNTGLIQAKRILIDLLSGVFLPLSFYPAWAFHILRWLPFQGISYVPNLAFSGALTGRAFWQAFTQQAGWVLALALLITWMWRQARLRLVVQGG